MRASMAPRARSIVAVAFLCQGVGVGSTLGAFTLFVDPVAEAFDSTRFEVSLGIAFMTTMLGLGGFFVGIWLDRGSIRTVMLTGATVATACLGLASQATSLWQLGALTLIAGCCIPMLGPLTAATLIGKAISEGRGRALGVANMGAPAGGLVFALIAGFTLEAWGWRGTLQLYAVLVASLGLPSVLATVPRDNRDLAPTVPQENGDARDADAPAEQWSPRRLLRTRDFLAAACGLGAIAGIGAGWSAHTAPFVSDMGGSVRWASTIVAVGAGMGIPGTLVFGTLADRVNGRVLLHIVLAVMIASFSVFMLSPSPPVILVTMMFLGLCNGGFLPVYAHLVTERFGAASLGRVMGVSNLFILPLGFGVPPMAGYLRDLQGSYTGAFAILIGIQIAGAIALSFYRGSGQEPQ